MYLLMLYIKYQMIIVVKRTAKMNDYTIGNLYIDG
nr:MAG TPA: hypothetical protein [Caudoviricetes sp.]